MNCDRCKRLIQPHETQAAIFRWSLVSEAGVAFINMTVCVDCAKEIDKAVSKEKKVKPLKESPKESPKETVVEKIKKKVKK